MEGLLEPVVSPSSVFIYRGKDKFICKNDNDLSAILVESLFETKENKNWMFDCTYARTHPLIFEFPLKNTTEFWMRYFDGVFLDAVQKMIPLREMTFILAMGQSRMSGLRIHVVGVELSHDDYLTLCERMKDICHTQEGDVSVELDSPSTFPLPSCDRPEGTGDLYTPVRLVRVTFCAYREKDAWQPRSLEHITLPQVQEDTFFNDILNQPLRWKEIARGMMPLPQPNATVLHFPTQIVSDFKGHQVIVDFKNSLNGQTYHLAQEKFLKEGQPFCYDFFKNHANAIELTDSRKPLLRTWYTRFQHNKSPLQYFQSWDIQLRKMCPHLKEESSPLTTVLATHERPVYYALYHSGKEEDTLRKEFPFLSTHLSPPKEANRFTFDTILYCAYRTGEGSMLDHMRKSWIPITHLSQLIDYMQWVRQTAFPMQKSLENVYAWDPIAQKWILVEDTFSEIKRNYQTIVENLHTDWDIQAEILQSLTDSEMDRLVNQDIQELNKQEPVFGNTMTELPEMYGTHVPEYYFFH